MLAIEPAAIGRILVREVNWVGDAVLTLPALEALDSRFPRAEIVLLGKPWVASLFAGHPAVDRVLAYRPEAEHRGLRGRLRLARELRAQEFALAVLFPNSFEAALIPWLARIPRRVGYATDARGSLLTTRLRRRPTGPARHQVEYYLDLARALGAQGPASPRLVVSQSGAAAAEALLAECGVAPGEACIALNPGSLYGTAKRWPTNRFAAAADALAVRHKAHVLLVGSSRETGVLREVAGAMRQPAIVLGGRTDLSGLAAVLRRSRMLLTNDTGAMHMAAAVGTPVVAVFGPTDPVATGPLGRRSRIVRQPVPCSPCLLRECPIDHRCMTGVEIEPVLRVAEELLNGMNGPSEERRRSTLYAPPSPVPVPAAFLDRDGTIIEDPGYLRDPDGIRFIPGAEEALRCLRAAGFRLVLMTNQAGVARGLLTEEDVRRVNERLQALLTQAGVPLDAIYYCPHHPEAGPPAYRRDCLCRKPAPGMARQAVQDLGLDPGRSVIIGDHLSDMGVAQHFPGMRAILLLTGHGAGQQEKLQGGEGPQPDHVAADLGAAVAWMLSDMEPPHGSASHST